MVAARKVLLLGGTGMLGAMVSDVLARDPNLALTVASRNPDRPGIAGPAREVPSVTFDAERAQEDLDALLAPGYDWVVNAIGVIKPYIKDSDRIQTERAIRVNGLFPHALAKATELSGIPVLQIATDCVYSGATGGYLESSPQDALDVYGKSKSLGEVPGRLLYHLRCSIIGPEVHGHVSLLDWFRGQSPGAALTGFTNHRWNGVTTYHFARICQGIITHDLRPPLKQHILPLGCVTKAEMLETFAEVFDRRDLSITRGQAEVVIDRTLATEAPAVNHQLWQAAGYAEPPSFAQMMAELARHPFNR